MSETDPRPAIWFLAKRAPQQYGNKEPDEREQIKRDAARELMDFLQHRARPDTFREICELLAAFGDTEIDPKALPVPD